MPVLIFIDQSEGQIKKSSFEAASYGTKVAEMLGTSAEAIVLGNVKDDLSLLGNYGIKKVHTVKNELLNQADGQAYTKIIADVALSISATVIIFSNNFNGKSIAPRLSVRFKSRIGFRGAVALPDITNGFTVKKNVFSGKAFANIAIKTDIKIIALNPNSFPVTTNNAIAEVIDFSTTVETLK